MSTTLTISDSEKYVSIVVAPTTMYIDDAPFTTLLDTLDAVNQIMPITTVSQSGTTYTVTLKDARAYAVTVVAGSVSTGPGVAAVEPKSEVVSTSYWNKDEVTVLQGLATVINTLLLGYGMTDITVNYS
jgi:hypothetical protein